MSFAHRLLTLIQDVGIPIGRWPAPSSLEFHLRRVLEAFEVDLVIDVGAHEGEYASLLRREARYTGDLLSFEPAGAAFKVVQERSANDARWRVEKVALGDSPGTAELQHYHLSVLNSFRSPSQFGTDVWRMAASDFETVPVVRLDEIDLQLGRYKAPMLKIDTQGFDLQVLRGAAGVIERMVALQFEIPMIRLYDGAPDFQDMLAEVGSMGFDVSGLFAVIHDPKLRVVEFDCIAVRST